MAKYTKVNNEEFISYIAKYQESVKKPLKMNEVKFTKQVHFYNSTDDRYLHETNRGIRLPISLFVCREGGIFEILTKLYEDYKED